MSKRGRKGKGERLISKKGRTWGKKRKRQNEGKETRNWSFTVKNPDGLLALSRAHLYRTPGFNLWEGLNRHSSTQLPPTTPCEMPGVISFLFTWLCSPPSGEGGVVMGEGVVPFQDCYSLPVDSWRKVSRNQLLLTVFLFFKELPWNYWKQAGGHLATPICIVPPTAFQNCSCKQTKFRGHLINTKSENVEMTVVLKVLLC